MRLPSAPILALLIWGAFTVTYSLLQAVENWRFGRSGPCWAPVWWIALTWPVWLVVIAFDVPWGPHWRGRRR